MKRIGDIGAGLLAFANCCGALGILLLMYSNKSFRSSSSSRRLALIGLPHSNLRGTKFIKLKTDIMNQMSKINSTLFTKEKFEEKYENYPKKLRKLDSGLELNIIPFLSIIGFLWSFILMFSFCAPNLDGYNDDYEKNDRDNQAIYYNSSEPKSDTAVDGAVAGAVIYQNTRPRHRHNPSNGNGNNDCGNFNCSGSGGNGGGLAVVLLFFFVVVIVVLIFIVMYYSVKGCGKHISRYTGIIGELIIYLCITITISIFLFTNGYNHSVNPIIICVISSVLVLFNFLGVLIPNLNCSQNNEKGEINKPLALNEENQEPIIINSDTMKNTTLFPIDISQKSNDNLIGLNDLPTNNVPNEPTYKPIDDLNRIQEGVYEAPPSIQEYPQPQSTIDLPSEQDIISNEIH